MIDQPRFRRSLLRWFSKKKRPLPWRQTRDPYAIWVSEVMLQQTTVATVIPYYERFLESFPTVKALAEASEDDVLALWSGLGYYTRARNLRLAAQTLLKEHAGIFPSNVEAAMGLRGVGRYTASAVTSIAYGTRAAVVDGNVKRVLARVFAERHATEARLQELADSLLSPRVPGAWNEAMMELGATVCSPASPRCDECPVARECSGRQRPEFWSALKARRRSVEVRMEVALVRRKNQVLLARVPKGDRMQGLYELPNSGLEGHATSAGIAIRHPCVTLSRKAPLDVIRHAVTHHRIQAVVLEGAIGRLPANSGLSFHPLSDLARLPLSGMTRKALKALSLLD